MESNEEAKPKIKKKAGSINRYAQIIKDLEQMLDYNNWLEIDSTKFSKDHGVTKSMLLLLCNAGCIERQKAKGKAALYEYRKTLALEVLTPVFRTVKGRV